MPPLSRHKHEMARNEPDHKCSSAALFCCCPLLLLSYCPAAVSGFTVLTWLLAFCFFAAVGSYVGPAVVLCCSFLYCSCALLLSCSPACSAVLVFCCLLSCCLAVFGSPAVLVLFLLSSPAVFCPAVQHRRGRAGRGVRPPAPPPPPAAPWPTPEGFGW